MDSQEYEEIARQMMGKEAYLIFSFDKLITQVSFALMTRFRPSK